ncbi:coiled-coil domain-containing protein 9 isoform X2 [Thalassophryne amazonica]|uniref:coiled-coil domain-containing protein 9 isoform X2 n=1 Tax=Thalassophryne amazonica TaxID=390379 RepID=UPI001470CA27|nr:coiled-coil domain-containing protein 9 isoform X2 [Thalassophryne amazonica]
MLSATDLKTKEEKDAELDRRIEALRKKNEALVKRYQEIEEDKKKAEEEGIAVTMPRKPCSHEQEIERKKSEKENFTVTVDLSKSAGEKRAVNDWTHRMACDQKTSESDSHRGQNRGHSPNRRAGRGRVGRRGQRGGGGGQQDRREREPRVVRDGEPGNLGGQGRLGGKRGRGGAGGAAQADRKSKEWEEKRRQNIEKMNEEMEKIAEYERGQRPDADKPIRNFLDDPRRSGPAPDTNRKEGSRRHIRNWGGLDFDNVKTGAELEKEWTSRRPGPKGSIDMTMSMTGRERAEYLRWKKEREQIDEERLARHRNAMGQWRREWDAQKTENMFKEDPYQATEGMTSEQGTRRDDSKRPPKAPTFGDFLSQGRTQGTRGDRNRGNSRGDKQSYSMHDNRWEGDKEEDMEKGDKTNVEEKAKNKEEEREKPKAVTLHKEEEKTIDGEDDDDEWEDASDGEDDNEVDEKSNGSEGEQNSRKEGKKDTVKQLSETSSPKSPASWSQTTTTGSPKDQRAPRPKVHIPPISATPETVEGGKPISPFALLDSHQPVSDWGEEMDMLSPRTSIENDLKPPSAEVIPPQKKNQEEERRSPAASSSEPVKHHVDTAELPSSAEIQEIKQTSSEPAGPTEDSTDSTGTDVALSVEMELPSGQPSLGGSLSSVCMKTSSRQQ